MGRGWLCGGAREEGGGSRCSSGSIHSGRSATSQKAQAPRGTNEGLVRIRSPYRILVRTQPLSVFRTPDPGTSASCNSVVTPKHQCPRATMIRRNVSKESHFDIEGASQDAGFPFDDDERRNTASKVWPRILCVIAAGAILLQVAYVMPDRLYSEPVAPTHSAFTADVRLAGGEPRKDDGLQQEAERMRQLKMKEEEVMRMHKMSMEEAMEVRKTKAAAVREQAICTDTKTECQVWAKQGECSRNWHFMHEGCQLSCSLLPGYAEAFDCRQPTSAEAAADAAKAEEVEAAVQQATRDAIKAADDAAGAKARARAEAAAAAKKSRAAAEATRAEADAKRQAAADAARAEVDAAAKRHAKRAEADAAANRQAAADAIKAEEEAAAKKKKAADAIKAEEEAAAKRQAAADAIKAEEEAAAKRQAAADVIKAEEEAAAKKKAAADAAPAACVDTSTRCAEWKGMGECDSNPKYMLSTCRKSCGKCEPSPACVDLSAKCTEWTGSGECDRNPEFMLKTCRKSCGKCELSPTSATAM